MENVKWGGGIGVSLSDSIERGIERMLASQEPSGYIGNYPDELRCGEGWDVWGMKYTMMGLLHYYDYANGRADCPQSAERRLEDKPPYQATRALDAATRLCDLGAILRAVGEKPQHACGETRLVRHHVIEHVVEILSKYAV